MSKLRSSDPEPTDGLGTSRSLLVRVRASDGEAWNRLVALYAPLVHAWCRRSGLQEADISDVFQEVFRAVASHIESFRRDRPGDSFRAWLRTITRNKVIDHFRGMGREPRADGGTVALRRLQEVPDPSEPDLDLESLILHEDDPDDQQQVLHTALEQIRQQVRENTWLAFWRTVIDERPAPEIAEELSMSPGAVRVAKCRVLQRLRDELGELL